MNVFQSRIQRLALLALALLLLPFAFGAQAQEAPEIRSVLVSVQTTDTYGQTETRRYLSEPEVKTAIGAARSLLLDVLMGFAVEPSEPIPYIFHCGGDFEQSSGTCADVIVMCSTLGFDFECNKEDGEGACTNGGC